MKDNRLVKDITPAWQRAHGQHQVAAQILQAVRLGAEPLSVVEQWADAIGWAFGSRSQLLAYLHGRWYTKVRAAIDEQLGEGARVDVNVAVSLVANRDPAVKAVLDAYADHPTVIEGEARQRAALARSLVAGAL